MSAAGLMRPRWVPTCVAVTSDGRIAYTANIRSGTVSVVDLKLGKKTRDIAVGGEPEGIALSREEQVLWVADLKGARVQAFDTESLDKIGDVNIPLDLDGTRGARMQRLRHGVMSGLAALLVIASVFAVSGAITSRSARSRCG